MENKNISVLAAVGCGVALGISSVYTFYRANRTMSDQMETLTHSIDGLKREVEELRIASQRGTPMLHSPPSFNRLLGQNGFFRDNVDGDNPPISELTSSDENDEFFDIDGDVNASDAISITTDDPSLLNGDSGQELLNDFLTECDSLFENTQVAKQVIYDKLNAGRSRFGENSELMWRLAKATHQLGIIAKKGTDKNLKEKLALETLEYAKTALAGDDNSAECHKWYAIAMGSMSDFVSTKEKIQNGSTFKEHVDKALEIRPDDSTLHHLLGRWCFEVAGLTWIERKVASTLFAAVPTATVEDAIQSLEKAYSLKPDWKENTLFLAKCCLSVKRNDEALAWIDKGLATATNGEDDEQAHKELLELRTKHFKGRA